MYALNRAQIIGHLTEDPQVRQTTSGQSVVDLNIVTKHSFKNAAGANQLTTSYHSAVVWGKLAENAGRYLKKGSQVYLSGRIQTDEWEDQNTGQKRYKTRITAEDVIFLDPKNAYPALPEHSELAGALNQAEIIGNITRDPELRQTPNGTQVLSFGVATNFLWKDRAGQQQEKTEFHNIVMWGNLAGEASQTLKKGRKIYVNGRLQTRSWETPDGNKRYTTEIIAERAIALGSPNPEIGPPMVSSMNTNITLGTPTVANTFSPQTSSNPFAGKSANVGSSFENPTSVPPVNYESEIRPEDLPF